MKRNHFLLLLAAALSFQSARAVPEKMFPVFPGRHYWYNPGALSYDSNTVINLYSKYRFTPDPIVKLKGLTETWLSAEVKMPRKSGAVGLHAGYEVDQWTGSANSRQIGLAYANSFGLWGGRLGIGAQLDMTRYYAEFRMIPGNTTGSGFDIKPDLSAGLFFQKGNIVAGISGRNLLNVTFIIPMPELGLTYREINDPRIAYMFSYKARLLKELQIRGSLLAEQVFSLGRAPLNPSGPLPPAEMQSITQLGIIPQVNATVIWREKYQLGASYSRFRGDEIAFNAGLQAGRADIFAIMPIYKHWLNRSFPLDFRAGVSFRLNKQ